MQAAIVDVLVQKGRFDPQIALAVAEAIDMTIGTSQLVTVPILDARLDTVESRVNARFDAVESRMNARFDAMASGVNVRFEALEARMDARFEAADAKTDAKLQSMKAELILWIIGMTVGSAFLPKLVAALSGAASVLR